jgi:hypothetical protein
MLGSISNIIISSPHPAPLQSHEGIASANNVKNTPIVNKATTSKCTAYTNNSNQQYGNNTILDVLEKDIISVKDIGQDSAFFYEKYLGFTEENSEAYAQNKIGEYLTPFNEIINGKYNLASSHNVKNYPGLVNMHKIIFRHLRAAKEEAQTCRLAKLLHIVQRLITNNKEYCINEMNNPSSINSFNKYLMGGCDNKKPLIGDAKELKNAIDNILEIIPC